MSEKIEFELEKLNVRQLKIGDLVFIEPDSEIEYKVLDCGDPFILIQDTKTKFAYLYEPNYLYKKIIKICH